MQLPDPVTFFLKTPLYSTFDLEVGNNIELTSEIFKFSDNFDAFCIECGKETTYHLQTSYSSLGLPGLYEHTNNDNSRTFKCTRDSYHTLIFHFKIRKAVLIKT